MNEVINNMLTRRSIRSFTEDQISEQDLKTILMAGSYAPSGMGLQTWKFTAIQKTDMIVKVNETIRKALLSIPIVEETHPYIVKLIEKAKDENTNFLYQAPTYIIVSNLEENGNAMADSALALGNMMLAAHSLGIGTCWLSQLPRLGHLPQIRELLTELNIPKDHSVYGSLAVGYPLGEPRPVQPRKDVITII